MKHIKTYENINEPQVGDYVICEEKDRYYMLEKELCEFIKNNIGKIVIVNASGNKSCPYTVQYENVPDTIRDNFFTKYNLSNNRNFRKTEIIFFSKYKSDVEAYLTSNKYNI